VPHSNSTLSKNIQTTEISNKELFPVDANKLLSNAPQAFTENRGQLENDEVRFYDQGGGLWFTDDGVWFEIREYEENNGRGVEDSLNPIAIFETPVPIKYRRIIFKQEFVGANRVQPEGRHRLSWNSNFFYGNDSSKWCTNVPNYREIYYENLYEGIDLRYYQIENGLKYDLIVHPEGDIKQIRIRYKGVENLKIDDYGDLIIETPIEKIIDGELFIYREYEETRHQVLGSFILYDNMEYGFEISDEYGQHETLVIDPSFIYSTFIGGNDDDKGVDIAIDLMGGAYVTGLTYSSNFPITLGVNDTIYNGNYDVFILKLNSNCSNLFFCIWYISHLPSDTVFSDNLFSNHFLTIISGLIH